MFLPPWLRDVFSSELWSEFLWEERVEHQPPARSDTSHHLWNIFIKPCPVTTAPVFTWLWWQHSWRRSQSSLSCLVWPPWRRISPPAPRPPACPGQSGDPGPGSHPHTGLLELGTRSLWSAAAPCWRVDWSWSCWYQPRTPEAENLKNRFNKMLYSWFLKPSYQTCHEETREDARWEQRGARSQCR